MSGTKSFAVAMIGGGLAGLAATIPMTMTMTRIHRQLPRRQRYALPPRIITDGLVRKSSLLENTLPSDGARRALAAHFAFGAATGAIYGLLNDQMARTPTVSSGVIYGLGIWTISYLGWVPAASLMPPATRQPRERNAMMIAAHIIWGGALGLATAAWLSGHKIVTDRTDQLESRRPPDLT